MATPHNPAPRAPEAETLRGRRLIRRHPGPEGSRKAAAPAAPRVCLRARRAPDSSHSPDGAGGPERRPARVTPLACRNPHRHDETHITVIMVYAFSGALDRSRG
ncbi:hypothetical protein GCM10018962_61520 [Dactylosporangium matsuzakiense]|uniref:Uncharacterized protein n=1 Tax=Dactylosporangium matsuzakiense TaxID=53360 RepID=A0A9W6KW87_9ACTN|nr:hypothetical protein GCM10017581_094880 [Dactylosporangium matsuzakiense]